MITEKSIGDVSMRESDDDNMVMDKYQNGFVQWMQYYMSMIVRNIDAELMNL